MARPPSDTLQTGDADWMTFPGGELEGKRPRALCPACRAQLSREQLRRERLSREQLNSAAAPAVRPGPKPICFQCYRAELERDRALQAAGQLETASEARFQCTLPFEPVNTVRLAALKAERAAARQARRQAIVSPTGMSQAIERQAIERQRIERQKIEQCTDRRRQAQIAARHALRMIADGLRTRQTSASTRERSQGAAERTMVAAIHAADLQLPESWLPFVVPG
jgi:hypothetical protein